MSYVDVFGADTLDDPFLVEICLVGQADPEYKVVVEEIMKGTKKSELKKNLPSDHPAISYIHWWDEMGVIPVREGLKAVVLYGHRLLIPAPLRRKVLDALHLGHAGIVKTRQLAGSRYFWAGLAEDVEKKVKGCETCIQFSASKPDPEELKDCSVPTAPMQKVSSDLFQWNGSHYMVLVCQFSGYPFVDKFRVTPSSRAVIDRLSAHMRANGFCETIRCDNGRQYHCAEFKEWCEDNRIKIEFSSPYHARSNGAAEAGVFAMKALLKKTHEDKTSFEDSLAVFRETPRAGVKMSPSRLFFRRQLRHPALFGLKDGLDEVKEGERQMDLRDIAKDRRNAKVNNPGSADFEMVPGLKCWLQEQKSQEWCIPVVVQSVSDRGSSGFVLTEDGTRYHRSKRFLKLRDEAEDLQVLANVVVARIGNLKPSIRRTVTQAGIPVQSCAAHNRPRVLQVAFAIPVDDQVSGALSAKELTLDGQAGQAGQPAYWCVPGHPEKWAPREGLPVPAEQEA
jgi:hypothetical protein